MAVLISDGMKVSFTMCQPPFRPVSLKHPINVQILTINIDETDNTNNTPLQTTQENIIVEILEAQQSEILDILDSLSLLNDEIHHFNFMMDAENTEIQNLIRDQKEFNKGVDELLAICIRAIEENRCH
jgi:hypothetical protein